MKHQSRLKVLQKLYIINNVIFRPHWLKPFSNWWKYNVKPSPNTKWRQISMECFHFSEQRFPRISLNKVPIISVQHFLLSILDYRHINFQWFPHFSIIIPIFHGERVLGCNQSKWPWHSSVCSVAPKDLWCFLFGALLIY